MTAAKGYKTVTIWRQNGYKWLQNGKNCNNLVKFLRKSNKIVTKNAEKLQKITKK